MMSEITETPARIGVPRRRMPPGTSPGTIVADPAAPAPHISLIGYGTELFEERSNISAKDAIDWIDTAPVLWIDIAGLGDDGIFQLIGEKFGLHSLALEDVVNVHQRPKLDEYEEHLFIVSRMPSKMSPLRTEQVSIFLGKNFVITFQERLGDCFEPVRNRIRGGAGRIRSRGADYLTYALLDAVTDGYFPVLEELGERIDELEDFIMTEPQPNDVRRIHSLKRDLLLTRRAVWPHRDMLSRLVRDESPLIDAETKIYLRDCFDHTFQLIDHLETYRDTVSDLADMFLSALSIRMGEVMKVLTVIATVFMPLTLISSIYGMNFDTKASKWNMPELGWALGYPTVITLMIGITVGMLIYFDRRGWIGPGGRRKARRRRRTKST